MRIRDGWNVICPPDNDSLGLMNILAIGILIALISITIALGSYYSHIAVTATICPTGLVLGWACGVLLSPSRGEGKQFSNVAKGITAFITGYAVSKMDTMFTELHQTPGFLPHLGLFLAFFVLMTITIYVNRRY
jgi:uncharacterized membrane protein